MKKRRIIHALPPTGTAWLPGLFLLSLCFLLGAVPGCVLAGAVPAGEQAELLAYLHTCLGAAGEGRVTVPALSAVLWSTFRWPGAVFLLSFTAVGLIGIPVLFGIRGFLLSFAVSSLVRAMGGAGVMLSALVFGITGVLALPTLFVLGVQGLAACRSLAGRLTGDRKHGGPIYGKDFLCRCGLCALVLILCVFLERRAAPAALTALAGRL